ncbi:MAG: sporulation protein YtfJ [Clostridia bacterium]|nr:MAG: sporulation protein YtfJ [Clostridia bacterium]
MKTAMENIKGMMEVNTVIGEAVEAPGGAVIIPVSRVSCGFAAGGSELEVEEDRGKSAPEFVPFGGGSGAGVSVHPVGFLVVGNNGYVRFLPVEANFFVDRILDLVPQFLDRLGGGDSRVAGREAEKPAEKIPRTWTSV